MRTTLTPRGFQVLVLSALGFVVAGVFYELAPATLLGFALMGAGFFLASTAFQSHATYWGRVGLGTLIAYVGMMPFFFEAFFPFSGFDRYFFATTTYLVGLIAIFVGSFIALRVGASVLPTHLTRIGAAAIAIAGLLWVPFDILTESYWWTFGNLATLVGGILLHLGFLRDGSNARARCRS